MGGMASSTTANIIDQNDDDGSYHEAAALYWASVHERGGSVLKDYYTVNEYRFRRANFISNLKGHSNDFNYNWAISKIAADQIFGTDEQLDVEVVRDRELQMEFDTLLPLPTTRNTQTIDNFKTCPPVDGRRKTDEEYEAEEAVEDGRDVPTPGGSSTHSTPVTSPVEGASTFDKYASHHLFDPSKLTSASDVSDLAVPTLPNVIKLSNRVTPLPQHAIPASTPGTTKTVADNLLDPALRKVTSNVPHDGMPPPAVPTQRRNVASGQTFAADPRVSSMAAYGMPVPVKTPKRQHTPEAEVEEASKASPRAPVAQMTAHKPKSILKNSTPVAAPKDSTIQTDTAEPALKKQKTSLGAAQPMKASTAATNPVPNQNGPPSSSLPTSAPITTAAPVATPSAHVATPLARLNDIISGRILPRSKAEAKEAATEQHNRLLTTYRNQAQNTNRKSARQSLMNTNPDPDFLPHYFSPSNFPANEKEDGSVRCVCGATKNDPNKGCFKCDLCSVWQHFECVLPEVDTDDAALMESMAFTCTVCDPYTHRHVLQQVRAAEGASKKNSKGQAKSGGKVQGKSGGTVATKGKSRGRPKK